MSRSPPMVMSVKTNIGTPCELDLMGDGGKRNSLRNYLRLGITPVLRRVVMVLKKQPYRSTTMAGFR
jgi:hypothetical protein